MNFTQQISAIATTSSNYSNIADKMPDRTSSETLSPNKKSRSSRSRRDFSVKEVRPQMVEVVEQAIQDLGDLSQFMLDKAFALGMQLTQLKRTLGKGKYKIEYELIVHRLGLTKPLANKYIKLVEYFGDFSTSLLKFVRLQTLFELCKSRYTAIIERMRSRTDLDDAVVRQWIKELKSQVTLLKSLGGDGETPPLKTQASFGEEVSSPNVAPQLFASHKSKKDPVSGWQRMPSGGGRYYQVLHDEETGITIDSLAKQENLLPQQITKKAIAQYKQRHHQSAEEYWNIQLDSAALESAITWEDVERAINSDRKRFNRAVKDWSDEKKSGTDYDASSVFGR